MKIAARPMTSPRLRFIAILVAAALLHLGLALISALWEFADGSQALWLAPGAAVGVAVAGSNSRERVAAVAGGLVGQATYLAPMRLTVAEYSIDLLAHALELCVAVTLLRLLLRSRESKPGPGRIFAAMAICLAAAATGGAFASITLGDASSYITWVLAHSIGMFGAAGVLLTGHTNWLSIAHPLRNPIQLATIAGALAGTLLASFWLDGALVYTTVALLLLLAARFGPRVGVPATMVAAIVVVMQTGSGRGPFASNAEPDMLELQLFLLAMITSVTMLGRIAWILDRSLQDERRAAARWKMLASTGYEAFLEVDANTTVIDASDSISSIFGRSAPDIIGLQFRDLFDDEGWTRIERFVNKVVQDGENVRFDRSFRSHDGQTRWALATAEPDLDAHGNFAGCVLFLLDTTATHKMNAERVESTIALAVAQEDERRRLAQVLHDGALQDLSAAKLLVGAARMDSYGDDLLQRIECLLHGGMQKLRHDAIGTEVLELNDLSLSEALRQVAAKFSLVHAPLVTIDFQGEPESQDRLAITLFQIGREALVNAMVHSHADTITVRLRMTDGGFRLMVEDDGVGFDDGRLQKVGHIGLSNMTALAYKAGGWCSVLSTSRTGTRVEAWLPLATTSPQVIDLTQRLASGAN